MPTAAIQQRKGGMNRKPQRILTVSLNLIAIQIALDGIALLMLELFVHIVKGLVHTKEQLVHMICGAVVLVIVNLISQLQIQPEGLFVAIPDIQGNISATQILSAVLSP